MIANNRRRFSLVTGLALLALVGCTGPTSTSETTTASTDEASAALPEPVAENSATAEAVAETAAPAAKAPRTAEPRPWEHETSDIPVDPRINFGAFANGMRWAWASHAEPKERVYVRLHVNIGSLAETESERGMAHFLEHMAFNGSKNFPAGTLIEWFQNNGMSFGADTNAHTAFSETVYKLDLPKNDPKTIRDGLRVLRDFADGMLIASEEVEAEKGVIDGEQRERDSAGFRVLIKQLDIAFKGTRIGVRLPIGTKPIRDEFSAESVRAFYERWYRPEHMTLVVVGDLGETDPVPMLAEAFADMPVPAVALTQEPGPGKPDSYKHAFAIYENEIPTVQLSFGRLKPYVKTPVTIAEWTKDMPLGYARRMLNMRFRELAKKEDSPFLSASAASQSAFEVFDGEGLDVSCTPEKWKEALAAGEQELRRALEHGFQQAELDEVRANVLRALDEGVAREATAPSRALLGSILAATENPMVATNAETRRDILRPAIEALSVASCHAAFVAAWSEGELSLTSTGNLDLGDTAAEQLRSVYEASTKVPVEANKATDTSAFAYASDAAKAGKIASRKHIDDLDFTTVTFENGVALNIKRTEFREKQIILSVDVGEGRLTLDPKDVLVLPMVGSPVMNGGGLEAHSADDLRRLTAGKQVGIGFGMGQDRFSFSGGTTAEDLLMECELAVAYLQAPGWRDDGVIQLRRLFPLRIQQMEHSHRGPAIKEFMPALFDGDPRIGFPTEDAVNAVGVEEVKAWLTPIFADAPIEISLVGDLDIEETIKIIAQTFGTLPKRREWNRFEERRVMPAPKSGIKQTHEIATQIPKSLALIAFPMTDGIDMLRRRKLQMLHTVVSDRLRLEVREKLGAAYSPGSGVQISTVSPGVGMLMMQAMADPDKVDTLVEACLAVADSLATEGVTDEELDRLREPILNRRRDAKRQNGYWLNVISRAQTDPAHLDNVRSGDAFYESVKAADLTPLAKEYLPSTRASILIVNPAK